MDALDALLDGPRARGAFLLRSVLEPPWALRIEDGAPLTLVEVTRGAAWVLPEAGEPRRLLEGDVAVVLGPRPYTMADDPSTTPQVRIGPGQECTSLSDGRHLELEWDLGVRTWGQSADGGTVLLTGTYERAGEVSARLLDALPQLLVLRRSDWRSPLLTALATELTHEAPGQRAVLDRLLDLVLIEVLRAWFTLNTDRAPRWYLAQADLVVGRALRLLSDTPARPWTVASLASECGVSRAALARRFTELVGEPPMAYLTGWRLALAADLLCQPGATIGAVARQVGYSTPFALSAAFKRERGIAPSEHRELRGTG